MGYYATLTEIEGKATKFHKEALRELNQKLTQGEFKGFEGGKVTISKEGYVDIELSEYFNKFYGDEKLAEELSKIIEEGYIKIEFVGEDGERWGYRITPNKIENTYPIKVTSSQHSRINLLDTVDLEVSSAKCPSCSYEASFFLTAYPINDETIKAIKEDSLENLKHSPICINCWMEVIKEKGCQVLEINYPKYNKSKGE